MVLPVKNNDFITFQIAISKMLCFKNLEGLRLTEIAQLFNIAFADYLLPFQLTEADLHAKIKAENIDLTLSVGAFDGHSGIGFILIGVDDVDGITTAYNAGTGVVPAYRGNHLTEKMYEFLFPTLAQHGIRSHLLEVLTENIFAIRPYEKIGFQLQRKLACYRGILKKLDTNNQIKIREIELGDLSIGVHFANQQTAYQNSFNTIKRRADVHTCLCAYESNHCVGYLIFDKQTFRIKQFGVHKNFQRNGVATTLFHTVYQRAMGTPVSIINIDILDEPTVFFLEKMGLVQYVQQLEMCYTYEH